MSSGGAGEGAKPNVSRADARAQSLERTIAILRGQQEASIDGILIIDEHRKVVSFNRRFLDIWQIDPAFAKDADDYALLGAVLDKLIDQRAFIDRVQYLYDHPLERSYDEVALSDGRVLDRYSGPVISDDGENFGRVWFFRDTTELRLAQAQAREFKQLGQYILEDKIGEGGMGIVYRASHALLRRPTAIKLLPTERAGASAIRRFEREVRLTSQLTHPNTIIVFDYGRAQGGTFYYAMEYLDGINFLQLVEQYGPQSPSRVVRLLAQACGALAEAHALGLIHRDVKPANLMLTERVQAPDFVKVLDFGLVKELDAELRDEKSVEGRPLEADTISGTPRFMPPEALLSPDKVDARSDLYALGAVGYFLLTGQPVFESKTLPLLVTEILHVAPMPPSQRVSRPIPDDLEKLILACLAKSKDDRPANAIELRKALLACACRDDFDDDKASAWWRAHREKPKSRAESRVPVSRATLSTSETVVGIDWKERRERAS